MKPVMIALLIVVFLVVARNPDDDDGSGNDTNPSASSKSDDSRDDGDDDDAPPDTGAGDEIVLTFDASPHPVHTPALLDVLAERGITAEFCVTDARAAKHPRLVAKIVGEGHSLCGRSAAATQVRLPGDEAATVADLPHVIDDIKAAGYSLSR